MSGFLLRLCYLYNRCMNTKDLDIIYFVKDCFINEELRFSLRSVAKNLPHRKVWAAVVDGSGSYITLGGAGSSTDYSTNYRGGGAAHNNLQPYIVVKRWHRTA